MFFQVLFVSWAPLRGVWKLLFGYSSLVDGGLSSCCPLLDSTRCHHAALGAAQPIAQHARAVTNTTIVPIVTSWHPCSQSGISAG